MKQLIRLRVNGEVREAFTKVNRTLLEVLREDLGLTGTKRSCDTGECGACTVLINGRPVNSCLTLAVAHQNKDIVTIEGLSEGGRLHPLQQAFVDFGSIQCGFCTPGLILSAKALLDERPNPTEEDIRGAIAGNICRCTGYVKVIEAVKFVAGQLGGTL